jgi:pentapeptide repeat protein
MANDEHVAILEKGVDAWNAWRAKNPDIRPDLVQADLRDAYLRGANLSGADLHEADLFRAYLHGANLSGANLTDADLSVAVLSRAVLIGAERSRQTNLSGTRLVYADLRGATLNGVNFVEANLRGANLSGAHLIEANFYAANLLRVNLTGADLRRASLEFARLMDTDLTDADLTGCHVFGLSAWNLIVDGAKQQNLLITRWHEPTVTVDNIEVAQFIYLMLHNQKIRGVIDTITAKVVLILGRFTDERKAVLDALREELRKCNYLPILFDFEVPERRNITETVTLLARMARFIIADLTDPSSIPQELQAIIPSVRVPVQPLLLEGSSLYSMFKDFDPQDFHWVLPVYRYEGLEPLLATLAEKVIAPAEGKVKALEERQRMIEAELIKPQ